MRTIVLLAALAAALPAHAQPFPSKPVRIMVVAPGMVATDEFSIKRFRGDAEAAAKVYAGVREPLVADDIADIVAWMITRPHHVNVDLLVVRPLAQAAQHKVIRDS